MNHERLFARSVTARDRTVADLVIDHLVILEDVERVEAALAINRDTDSLGATGDQELIRSNELRFGDRVA